ncbi:MAG TPA: DUF4446 family protein [Solirubrobacteraceae bacterium]
MNDLSTTTGIVALAAAVLAVAALVAISVLARRVRRLTAEQRSVLGERGERDLVAHAVELQQGFAALSTYVEDVATRLDARLGAAEGRLDGAIAFRGIVRYDAYNEMSGRQSTSIALLDAHRSGVVLSTIHHRDQARMYAKQIVDGAGLLQLSPEEEEAIRIALAGEMSDTAERA